MGHLLKTIHSTAAGLTPPFVVFLLRNLISTPGTLSFADSDWLACCPGTTPCCY